MNTGYHIRRLQQAQMIESGRTAQTNVCVLNDVQTHTRIERYVIERIDKWKLVHGLLDRKVVGCIATASGRCLLLFFSPRTHSFH